MEEVSKKPFQYQCQLLKALIMKQRELMCLERGKNLGHGKSFLCLKCKLLGGVDTIIRSACRSCSPGSSPPAAASQENPGWFLSPERSCLSLRQDCHRCLYQLW